MTGRKAAILVISAAGLFLVYTACLYLLVPKLAFKKVKSAAARQGYTLKSAAWKHGGFSCISFDSLLLINARSDTLLAVNKGMAGYSVWRYLKGHFPVDLIQLDSLKVFRILSSDSATVTRKKTSDTGWAMRLFKWESKLRSYLPRSVNIHHASLTLLNNPNRRQWIIENFEMNNSAAHGKLKTGEGAEMTLDAKWNKNLVRFELNALMNSRSFITATSSNRSLQFAFRKANWVLKKVKWNQTDIVVQSGLKGEGLQFYHWRISDDTVAINRFETSQQVSITNHSVKAEPFDVQLNDISIKTKLQLEGKDKGALRMQAEIPAMPAQAFFQSLPVGLFRTFKGIRATGELGYSLRFDVDLATPDSLIFESAFHDRQLKIQQFGEVNPYRLNDVTEHTVYEKGRPVRRILLDSSNPEFVPYPRLPPALIHCVLTAEDGSFFGHTGFNEEAFRQSIITNIKERRFARGGSTISMQLVKNLYLGREKNISRKMEEALWVWLIENKRMVSKERMLEIYLNIIEWGPDVYGIKEAAHYYFNKKPEQLSLNECIFLAGIIPNPKNFRYAFDKEGNLRNYFQTFFRVVSERLLMKEKITEAEFLTVNPHLKLTGPAAQWIMPADTLPDFDTKAPEEEEE